MKNLTTPSERDSARLINLIFQGSAVERHLDLLNWLHGDLQDYLPHDIMVTGWGNFEEGTIQHDIVSELPGVRSYALGTDTLPFLLGRLRDCWLDAQRKPCSVNFSDFAYLLGSSSLPGSFSAAMSTMKSALIHGIRDERGNNECIYVLLSAQEIPTKSASMAFDVLMPCMDTALRKVKHLPRQCSPAPSQARTTHEDTCGLSERETQIMNWVAMGKTNSEIGMILTISGFTVKNHMQRIFQKLNVFNRAQAVSKVIRVSLNA